ncbi:MAG: hypothetical protein U0136_20685 [Bdellovibrionota bacterium]
MTEQSTLIIADTHVHVYPCYDLSRFFEAAAENLERIIQQRKCEAGEAAQRCSRVLGVLFLTERFDCHYFDELSAGKQAALPTGWSAAPLSDKVVRATSEEGAELLIVSGYQVITLERLEVLTLNSRNRIPDGLPLSEVLSRVLSPEIPVLNWSLGKWMFGRGKTVGGVIKTSASRELIVGDIRARPLGWGEPRLLAIAKGRGVPMIAGSDPLPVRGEEKYVLSYASEFRLPAGLDEGRIGDILQSALASRSCKPGVVGHRGNPLETFFRLRGNSMAKKS